MVPTKGAIVAAGFGILIVAAIFMVARDGASLDEVGLAREEGEGGDLVLAGPVAPATVAVPEMSRPTGAAAIAAESRREVPGDAADPRFSAALLAYARDEIRRGWRERRDDEPPGEVMEAAIGDFETRVSELPFRIGRAFAEMQDDREELERARREADGVTLIRLIDRGAFRPTEADARSDLIDSCVTQRAAGAVVDGARFLSEDTQQVADGTTLRFGSGMHTLDPRRLWKRGAPHVPADLTIVGAGIDATVLRLAGSFDSRRAPVERMLLRDLTIDTRNNYLFDLRSKTELVLDLERVRVVGFDMGAGGSCACGTTDGMLLRARHCEFLVGFGRSPQHNNLICGRPVFARLEDCYFDAVDLNLRDVGNGFILFDSCRFTGYREEAVRSSGPVVFSRSMIDAPPPGGWPSPPPQRKLSEILPWLQD